MHKKSYSNLQWSIYSCLQWRNNITKKQHTLQTEPSSCWQRARKLFSSLTLSLSHWTRFICVELSCTHTHTRAHALSGYGKLVLALCFLNFTTKRKFIGIQLNIQPFCFPSSRGTLSNRYVVQSTVKTTGKRLSHTHRCSEFF